MVFLLSSAVDLPLNLNNLNNIKLLLNTNNLNNSKLLLNPQAMLVKLMLRLSQTVLKPTTTTLVLVNGISKPSSLANKWLPITKLSLYIYTVFFSTKRN
jgi:hypothetical protein